MENQLVVASDICMTTTSRSTPGWGGLTWPALNEARVANDDVEMAEGGVPISDDKQDGGPTQDDDGEKDDEAVDS